MAKLGKISFTGVSGSTYDFNAYPLDETFKAIGAVYFITRRYQSGDSHKHDRIYIGQTGDLSERFDNHHDADCFADNGANCVCVHADNNKQSRLKKERDLIDKYQPPCNG